MPHRLLALLLAAAAAAAAGCTNSNLPSLDVDMSAAPDLTPDPCRNFMQDGQETATDCGGPTCMPCDTGDACKKGRDCASGFCTNAKCDAPSCSDGAKNGTESDKDCGGTCPGCEVGLTCNLGSDCDSKTCTNGVCVMGPCMNGRQDGSETDIDCGGSDCMPCDDGKMCILGADCLGMLCTNNLCHGAIMCSPGTANCDGDVGNGCEVDTNSDAKNCGRCGGACPMGTPSCDQGVCTKFVLFPSASYNAGFTFVDKIGAVTMPLAWDGTNYWGCHSGDQNSLVSYDAKGALVQVYADGIDFRSVFTFGGKKPVYAKIYNRDEIDVMGNPGTFGLFVQLTGAPFNSGSSMVYDDTGAEIIAFSSGTITRWDGKTGKFIGNVMLQGYGGMNNENAYPQNRSIAMTHGYYLTYTDGVLSAWDSKGVRQKTTNLNGAGRSFSSYFSFSYTHGMVFVVDDGLGVWRGYNVGL